MGTRSVEIGYWVRASRLAGHRPATARALTTAVFQLTGIRQVHVHCDEANRASAGVLVVWGFVAQTLKDEVDAPAEVGRSMEWAITASEWKSIH